MKIHATVNYMNKEISFCVGEPFGILGDEGMIFDAERLNGKGMEKGVQFFNNSIVPKIIGFKCAEQNDIDKQIEAVFKENGDLGLYQVNTMSYILPKIRSHVLSRPLYEVVAETA